jgi:hypothetical protein
MKVIFDRLAVDATIESTQVDADADRMRGKLYRGNAPKIMLETISARTPFIIDCV